MRSLGCLVLLGVIGFFCAEVYVFLLVVEQTKRIWGTPDLLAPLLAIIAISYIGVRVAIHHGRKLPQEMLSGNAGRRMLAVLGGVALAFPGFISDIVGLLLLLPPTQKVFAKSAGVLAGALARQAMARAMGGKSFPGFSPGQMPGGGMFPGMKPDDRGFFPKATKTIDTTVEKDDDKPT